MPTRVPLPSGATPAKALEPSRMLLFGDSHTNAVQRAIEKRKGKGVPAPLEAHRLLKEKNGRQIGDTAMEAFLDMIGKLGPRDVVFSMIGGNQHSIFSLVKHPQRFDFFTPENSELEAGAEIVPYRALQETFQIGLRNGDGKSLEALRKATKARLVHIIPPPPKGDNAFIERNHETQFAAALPSRGVSPPAFRLKFWQLQTDILKRICTELGIEVMMPPRRTIDAAGFLRPEFYAQDATHGNWRYGERVLREIEQHFAARPAAERAEA